MTWRRPQTVPFSFALALALCATAGCGAHVRLDYAPAPEAPREERVAYYARHAPRARIIEVDAVTSKPRPQRVMRLELANGAVVRDPEDLVPAVGAYSATAIAARAAAKERDGATPWLLVAGTATALAVGSGLLVPFVGPPLLLLTVGLLAVAMPLYIVAGRSLYASRDEVERAFMFYPEDLATRLGLRIDPDGRLLDDPDVPPSWKKRRDPPPLLRDAGAPP